MSNALPTPDRLTIPIDPAKDHVTGTTTAQVVVLEYGDYECPDCGKAYPLLKQLQKNLPGKFRFAFRHFPLFTLHRHASVAAQAAEAAAAQGKFWQMHDLLYQHQNELEVTDLSRYAMRIGLEIYGFESALSQETYLRRVEQDFLGGQANGVTGTPTLFINDEKFTGPLTIKSLQERIEQASR